MMTNLFSIFDPTTSILSMSWMVVMMAPLMVTTIMWKSTSPTQTMMKKIMISLKKEIMNKTSKKEEMVVMTMFLTISTMNMMALYPQMFSPTSHLCITLPLSLTVWLALNMFGWLKNTKVMLSHLVPQGTPGPLMMFMVVIELISNMIRPITLCVRLTANLIAGHLLLSLVSNTLVSASLLTFPGITPMLMTLTILELAVALIQAYVFSTLIYLYMKEVE